MKSLAIWTKNENVKIDDLHINIWKLPYEKNKKNDDFYRVIDFGFMFDLNDLNEEYLEFNFFYPEIISKSDIEDLIKKLYDNIDSKLISTLFNDNLILKFEGNDDFASVSKTEFNNDFFTYKIKLDKINFNNKYNGTELSFKIKLPQKVKNSKLYIRFRIKKDYSDVFSTIDKPSNAILQSKFSKTELFNFRINEVRDISNELLEEIHFSDQDLTKFNKIHIFYICSAKDEYQFSHKNYEGVRILERSKWETYINEKILYDNSQMLAYHFKEKSNLKIDEEGNKIIKPIIDYNFLIQTKYEINDRFTIFYYLSALFLITLSFNLISNFFWENGRNGLINLINFSISLFGSIIEASNKTILILILIVVSILLLLFIVMIILYWKKNKSKWKQ